MLTEAEELEMLEMELELENTENYGNEIQMPPTTHDQRMPQLPGSDMQAPAQEERVVPGYVQDTPGYMVPVIAAGKTTSDLIDAGSKWKNKIANAFFDDPKYAEALFELDKRAAEDKEAYTELAKEFPVSTFVGESLPYLATPLSTSLIGNTAIGAGLGAFENPDKPITGALASGAGTFVGDSIGRLYRRSKFRPEGENDRILQADEMGYPLTYSDRTGSNSWKNIEAMSNRYPLAPSPIDALEVRQNILNKEALKAIGFDESMARGDIDIKNFGRVTEDNLKLAHDANKQKFQNALGNKNFSFNDDTHKTLNNINTEAGKTLLKNTDLKDMLTELRLNTKDGTSMTSEFYQKNRRALTTKAISEMTSPQGNKQYGAELMKIVRAMDDAVDVSLTPRERQNLMAARREYQNTLAIEKGQAYDIPTGNVNPKSMESALKSVTKNNRDRNYRTDTQDPFFNTVKVANVHKPLQSSGTAEGLGFESVASTVGIPSIAGSMTGSPLLAGIATGVGLGAPYALGMANKGANALASRARTLPTDRNRLLRSGIQQLGSKAGFMAGNQYDDLMDLLGLMENE